MLFFFFSETRVMKKKAQLCLQVQQFFDFSLLTNSSRAISIDSFLVFAPDSILSVLSKIFNLFNLRNLCAIFGCVSATLCVYSAATLNFLNVKIVDVGYINAYSSLFSFASSCSIFSRRRISQTDAPMAKGSKMYWMISSFDRGVGGISGRGTCVDCVD